MTRNTRPKGTGSLYQRADGYWIGSVRHRTASGGRSSVSVGSWDRDVAEARLDALVAGEKLPANLGDLRARDAEKWDEGWDAGYATGSGHDDAENPYKDS